MDTVGIIGEMSVHTVGKDFCPNFLQPVFENCDGSRCNDGSQNSHRNDPSSTLALARSLECLVGVPSYAASS